jgi:ATP/maltotriose-dependent transcriptional regulator MalT
MGPGAADIAEVVSEVRGKLPNLGPPPALQPEQARFRLFDSITTFLKNAAQSQPLMLILDDLHWADKPSLLLLQFLARQLGESHLLVVGSYRDLELSRQHPLSAALAQLSRLPVFQRELLLGISQEDTGQFIEMTAGMRPSPQLVETIHAHTEGNPFFLKEMTRLLSERGELRAAGIGEPEGIRIPQGVREVIGQRLNRLSESCHQTLTIASIIGREFDFRLLRTLSDETTDEQLLGVIDEALAAHLVEELPGGRERYRFSHALIQQTLAEGLSSSRKVRWHARIGEALEGLYGADVEAHAAELVYHFAEATAITNTKKLVYYSLMAGENALAVYAYEEAKTYFERGLAAKKGQPTDAESAVLLFGLGRAQVATAQVHQMQEAIDTLNHTLDYYAKTKDVPRVMAVAEYPMLILPGFTRVNELIARALNLVPPDSHEAGRLLSRYGYSLFIETGSFQRAEEAFSRALTIAQQKQDAALEMRTLALASFVEWNNLRYAESLEKSLCAIELTHLADDSYAAFMAYLSAFAYMWMMGDLKGMQQHAGAALTEAEKLRDRYRLGTAFWFNELVNLLEGNWQAAREFNERGLAVAGSPMFPLCNRAKLEYEVGDFVQGDVYLGQLLESMTLAAQGLFEYCYFAVTIPAIAHITGTINHFDSAQKAAESILALPLASPFMILVANVSLAMMAVQRGDSKAAMEQYAVLEPKRDLVLRVGWDCLDRLLGLLSTVQGRLDRAIAHFEDALAFCCKAGYRPEVAWTCYDYAEALLQRSHPGDHARAMSLLEGSLAIAQELGMRPLAERVATLQEQSQPRNLIPAYPDGLSQREVEVLCRVAAGKSNREIAEELVIAEGTVRRHVSNIYNKIGAINRSDATRYAMRAGLVEVDEMPSTSGQQ